MSLSPLSESSPSLFWPSWGVSCSSWGLSWGVSSPSSVESSDSGSIMSWLCMASRMTSAYFSAVMPCSRPSSSGKNPPMDLMSGILPSWYFLISAAVRPAFIKKLSDTSPVNEILLYSDSIAELISRDIAIGATSCHCSSGIQDILSHILRRCS